MVKDTAARPSRGERDAVGNPEAEIGRAIEISGLMRKGSGHGCRRERQPPAGKKQ